MDTCSDTNRVENSLRNDESDRHHNPGGPGYMRAGDHSMAFGDIASGANLRDQVVLMERKFIKGRGTHVFNNEPGFVMRAYVDGELKSKIYDGNIRANDLGWGLLRHPELRVLSVNINPTPVASPATVFLADRTSLDCVVTAYFVCNPNNPRALYGLFNGNAQPSPYGDSEIRRSITAEVLGSIQRNTLANLLRESFSSETTPSDSISKLTTKILEANRHNGLFAMQGLSVVYLEIRFGQSDQERWERFRRDMDRDHDHRMKDVQYQCEEKSLKMKFIMNEYNMIDGGGF